MIARADLGIAALFPAAFNVAPAAAASVLMVPVCMGDGRVHLMSLPGDGPPPPGKDGAVCCAKACHAGGSRKRADKQAALPE